GTVPPPPQTPRPVLLGKDLPAPPPAVHVVVAHDVQGVEELQGGGTPLGRDVVVAGGDWAGGILSVENILEPAEHPGAVRGPLLPDFIAGAPQHDRGMIAVPPDEIHHVPLGPLGEI